MGLNESKLVTRSSPVQPVYRLNFMSKKNDELVSIAVRFVITGRPDDINVLAAKWLRENRDKAIEFLAEGKKSEILADERYPPEKVSWAKVESAAFHTFRASALTAQLAADNFHYGQSAIDYHSSMTVRKAAQVTQPKQPLELNEDDDDDFDDDDDEMIVTAPEGF